MTRRTLAICALGALVLLGSTSAVALEAGAAKRSITPKLYCDEPDAPAYCPPGGYELRLAGYSPDRFNRGTPTGEGLYARAIVLKDAGELFVLATSEQLHITDAEINLILADLNAALPAMEQIPRAHFFLSATHDHSAPKIDVGPNCIPNAQTNSFDCDYPWEENTLDYKFWRRAEIVQTILDARDNLEPAQIGTNRGTCVGLLCVNVNRQELSPPPAPGHYAQCDLGEVPSQPSDKTMDVLRIESTASGEVIAAYVTYGVHPTGWGDPNEHVRRDIPGATSAYIEEHYAQIQSAGMVAVWAPGGAGNQGPIDGYQDPDDPGHLRPEHWGDQLGSRAVALLDNMSGAMTDDVDLGADWVEILVIDKAANPTIPSWPVHLQGLRLTADTILVGISMEVFSQTVEAIRDANESAGAFSNVLVVTDAAGASGYLPDEDTWTVDPLESRLNCYETYQAQAGQGSETIVLDEVASLIQGLIVPNP